MKRENEDVWLAGNDMSFESDWRWAIHFFVVVHYFLFFIPALFNLDGPMGLLMTTGALLSTLEALLVWTLLGNMAPHTAKTMRTVSS